MRTEGFRLLLVLAPLALPSAACFHATPEPPPTIVRQAAPNPFVGMRSYAFAPITFNGFTYEGQTEEAWQATRSPRQQASWQGDKASATAYILERIPRWLRPGEQIDPLSTPLAPGRYAIALNVDAWIHDGCHTTLRLLDAQGQPVDEVVFSHEHVFSRYGFADGFRTCLIFSTTDALQYLRSRYAQSNGGE
jgi:hypothetical protein